VKGFSEALITDLALNAPHIKVSVVMPGHIGTSIVANSRKVMTCRDEDALSETELERARARIGRMGMDVSQLPDAALQAMVDEQARRFLEDAPMTAAAAATVILDGVKADRWRILVGEDAQKMDAMVRKDPEAAYTPEFYDVLIKEMGWRLGR
jgi:short-subunit dehydrogenase